MKINEVDLADVMPGSMIHERKEEHHNAYVYTGLHMVRDTYNKIGIVVQVRLECGAFGSDKVFIRHCDGKLIVHENQAFFLTVAFVLFVVAGLTDIADGAMARRLNVTSKFGRIVDPLADKVLVCGSFISFALIGEPKLFDFSDSTLKVIH